MASSSEAGTSHALQATASSSVNSVVGSSNLGDWVSKYVDPSVLLNGDAVGVVANTIATQLGLELKGDTTQKAVYVLSYAAVVEIASQVFGVGASFSSMDLTGFTLAQIKQTLQEIKRMIGVILETPLKNAIEKMTTAFNLLENYQISEAIIKLRDAENDAITAYHYAVLEGNSLVNFEKAIIAKKLQMCSKLCIYSYNSQSEIIQPFEILDESKQRVIAVELERDCLDLTQVKEKIRIPTISVKRSSKQQELQTLLNSVLKIAYPFISEALNYIDTQQEIDLSDRNGCIDVKVDERILPMGMKDAAMVKIGRRKVSSSLYFAEWGVTERESNFVHFHFYRDWSKLDQFSIEDAKGANVDGVYIEGHWFQHQHKMKRKEQETSNDIIRVSLPTYIPKVIKIQLPFQNTRCYGVKYRFSTQSRKRRVTYINNKNDGIYVYKSMDNKWHFLDVNDSSSSSFNVEYASGIIPPVRGWISSDLAPENFERCVHDAFDDDELLITSVREKVALDRYLRKVLNSKT